MDGNKDMELASQMIKYINNTLQTRINQINDKFNHQYSKALDQFQQHRFRNLQSCLSSHGNKQGYRDADGAVIRNRLLECVGQYQGKQMKVDFDTPCIVLNRCINKIMDQGTSIKSRQQLPTLSPQIGRCADEFENQISKQLNFQIQISIGATKNDGTKR